jgi:tetratricopeptide (TPR) repeat protein
MRYLSSISLAVIVLMALAVVGCSSGVSEENAGSADVYFKKGENFYNQKSYSKAIDAFDKSIGFDPNHYEAHALRAWSYESLGHHNRAIKGFDKLIKIAPDKISLTVTYIARGNVYEGMREYAKARDDYIKVCELGLEIGDSSLCKPGIIEQLGVLAGK